jgi:hypothetical protein
MGLGNGQSAPLTSGNIGPVVNIKIATPDGADFRRQQQAQLAALGVRAFQAVPRTRRQVVVDRITEWVAVVVSIAIMGLLVAALLRFMGLWFW